MAARSIRLRPWQKLALERLTTTESPDFLTVATPGAGKTTFALTAARQEMASRQGSRLVVVAPTQHLKVQWAENASRFDLYLEPMWSPADGLPGDFHGVVTTYQQVANDPEPFRSLSRDGVVVLDEIHHAADERAWGGGVRRAFELAGRRIGLSGTPFRSDTQAIPFVNYRLDEAVPDFEYGYKEALADGGVVRPVFFPRLNGHMEWVAPDGQMLSHTFDDALGRVKSNQRLRTALSLDGEWMPAVIRQGHALLADLRRTQANAAGLVIATDQDHARGIADMFERRFRVRPTLALSDEKDSSERIARFAESQEPWIVAVRMVSEGVDIPRLRVGVYATTTTTELFFRQAVGRLVRWNGPLRRQRAYMLIPDDSRLRTYSQQIADHRRHSLRKPAEDGLEPPPEAGPQQEDPTALDDLGDDEQLSLFAAVSATPLDDEADRSVFDPDHPDDIEWNPPPDDQLADLELPLAPLPPLAGAGRGSAGSPIDVRTRRKELREENSRIVAELALVTGWTHGKVNAELNRLTKVKKVTEATVEQLEARRDQGERWLERARYRLRRAAR
ncbi:MAG: DEAD/DEAH box helicase family protein [Actinomycetota bacterium]|nr:DEAD/DEAH box helicase family protein [Actinomycetota bacterium]